MKCRMCLDENGEIPNLMRTCLNGTLRRVTCMYLGRVACQKCMLNIQAKLIQYNNENFKDMLHDKYQAYSDNHYVYTDTVDEIVLKRIVKFHYRQKLSRAEIQNSADHRKRLWRGYEKH